MREYVYCNNSYSFTNPLSYFIFTDMVQISTHVMTSVKVFPKVFSFCCVFLGEAACSRCVFSQCVNVLKVWSCSNTFVIIWVVQCTSVYIILIHSVAIMLCVFIHKLSFRTLCKISRGPSFDYIKFVWTFYSPPPPISKSSVLHVFVSMFTLLLILHESFWSIIKISCSLELP